MPPWDTAQSIRRESAGRAFQNRYKPPIKENQRPLPWEFTAPCLSQSFVVTHWVTDNCALPVVLPAGHRCLGLM